MHRNSFYRDNKLFRDQVLRLLLDHKEMMLVYDFHYPLIAIEYEHRQVYSIVALMKSYSKSNSSENNHDLFARVIRNNSKIFSFVDTHFELRLLHCASL